MNSVDTDSLHSEDRVNGNANGSSIGDQLNGRTETVGSGKKREKRALVDSLIQNCKDTNLIVLDLNKKAIQRIPEQMLQLTHLQVGNMMNHLNE